MNLSPNHIHVLRSLGDQRFESDGLKDPWSQEALHDLQLNGLVTKELVAVYRPTENGQQMLALYPEEKQ